MNLIRSAIDRPIAVVAAVLMVILFGLVALQTIPIQLAPDVNRPVITVTTIWAGAAPAEVEREIVNRQEEQMSGLEGLDEITSNAELGRARMTLGFKVGANMDKALLLVSNRLDRVTGYPDEADQPSLDTAGSEDSPIAWFYLQRTGENERPMHEFGDFLDDVVKDRLERVPGVGRVNVFGGSARQLQVRFSPDLLAQYRLTVASVLQTLRSANISISAGYIDEGKRRYTVRAEGELNTPERVRQVILRSVTDGATGRVARIRLGDVASVEYGYQEPSARIRMLGIPGLVFNTVRETGANVIETMRGIRAAVDDLNKNILPDRQLAIQQVYDETVYINSAIELVRQNIWLGGSLAVIVLLLFLRSIRATFIVSIAIPVSVIGAFVAMALMGRSINVISLAGFAFAVGMVVDAAIVVLENIFRLREGGMPTVKAAYEGARQVWSAVLVSVLTTVMVFIPILIMDLEIGQLFRDIAVAISVSVMLSLIVSVTVIPALAKKVFGPDRKNHREEGIHRLAIPLVDNLASAITRFIINSTKTILGNRTLSIATITSVTVLALGSAWMMLPKLEYLPEGNRNLVFGVIIPPPGYNLETMTEIAKYVENETKPHWASLHGPESKPGEPPKISRIFFVATRARAFVGAASADPQRAAELIPILRKPVFSEPGTFGFISQPSIFGRGIGAGRRIDFDISGPDLETILDVAGRALRIVAEVLPRQKGNQLRPNPGLELGAPEIRIEPNRLRLADNGVTARELAAVIDAANDGLRITEITDGSNRINLMLMGPKNALNQTQKIGNIPVVTPAGKIVPVSTLADVVMTAGPTALRHRERERTITLEIRPAPGIALEAALDILRASVINKLHEDGLPPGVKIHLSGTADQLTKTWDAMVVQLALALIIVFLVLAVLFESFIYPLVILLSVPVAAVGGVAGLAFLNLFKHQPLDMLTLLGFVILIGIVVNNAILLVHQALYHYREHSMEVGEAILVSTKNRLRPIFMSTLTSVFGMLPLVLFPGAGSELYRGLGLVVVGGLSMSAMLTLLIVPPMLGLLMPSLELRYDKREPTPSGSEHQT